jgi:RNA-directed DNA polymerase
LRLIHKWLKAGVSEEGEWSETKVGTPQGAVISLRLANVYLHYVFDQWVDAWRKRLAKGEMFVIRYADDLVLGFERREDAARFLKEFGERPAKFGLEPQRTRKSVERENWARSTSSVSRITVEPSKADLSYGARRRANGCEPSCSSSSRSFDRRMHDPLAQVGEWLGSVQRGYYQYHAVPGNSATLGRFRHRFSGCGGR